ncbi:hypothetical protein LCGC14_2513710, partial [marine sediment metagenome]
TYLIKLDDGTIVFTNPTFEEMFGYNPGEMIGKNVASVNAPTDKTPEETREEIMGILEDTGEWHGEVLNVKKDGTPFWCYANVSPFDHPEYGTVIVSVHTDITERKKIELELKESEHQYRTTINFLGDPIYVIDKDYKIILVNEALEQWVKDLNLDQEIIGKTPKGAWSFLPDFAMEEYCSIFNEGNPIITIGSVIINNKEITTETRKIPIFENEEITQIITIIRDITESKEVERKLKDSEAKFRVLFNNTNDSIFILDRGSQFIEINKTACERLGYTREELLKMGPKDLIHPESKIDLQANIKTLYEKGEIVVEAEQMTKDGDRFPVEISSRIFNYTGKSAIISVARDITERKVVEQKLKESEHMLRERVKELTCLYGLSKLVENPVISLRDIINGTLNLIPSAFQFPDITTARITYDGRDYKLGNFEETEWKLSTMVKINEKSLLIEVFYLEDKPFLKEEHELINEISIRLKTTFEEKEVQKKLYLSEDKYRN